MPVDPETVGFSIGSLLVGLVAGGTAMYKMVKRSFTNMATTPIGNGVLSAFTKELAASEIRAENKYLTTEAHAERCKISKLEGQISLRVTLDEIFKVRDEKLDKKFDHIAIEVERNRQIVTGHYENILKEIRNNKP